MSRFVALLIALLLPLQFAWGAAAAYCQHEPSQQEPTIESSRHFGHHEHVHEADVKKADVKKVADTKLMGDNDCGTCHATCSAVASAGPSGPGVLIVAAQSFVPADARLASALARAPDRPQWLRLA